MRGFDKFWKVGNKGKEVTTREARGDKGHTPSREHLGLKLPGAMDVETNQKTKMAQSSVYLQKNQASPERHTGEETQGYSLEKLNGRGKSLEVKSGSE